MRKRPVVIALIVVAGIAGGLLAIVGGFLYAWNCSSGDGGVPFVAPDSPQAGVCDATGDGILLILLALAAVGGIATAAWFVGKAWLERRRSVAGFIALTLLTVLAPIVLLWVASVPSSDCTGEKEGAFEAWNDAGRRGEAPYECDTY